MSHQQTQETRDKIAAALRGNKNTLGKRYEDRHPRDPVVTGERISVAVRRRFDLKPYVIPDPLEVVRLYDSGVLTNTISVVLGAKPEVVVRILDEAGRTRRRYRPRTSVARANMVEAQRLRRELDGSADKRRVAADREAVYKRLALEQDGVCAICGERKPLFRDHDHQTGAVRGWLCLNCNVRLAFLEDEEFVKNGTAYLASTHERT